MAHISSLTTVEKEEGANCDEIEVDFSHDG